MAEFPAMPLWTDAYLADCGHLNDAEHGRYFLLMMYLWRAPEQRLPNDNTWLARKFCRSEKMFMDEVRPIIDEFCQCDGNWIRQKRTTREFAYIKNQSMKQSERAKSRWKKEKELCRGSTTSGIAPTPTPTPTPHKKEIIDQNRVDEFEIWFAEYPRKVAKGAARKAFVKAVKKTEFETLIAAVKDYASASAGKEPEFIAHPATWLNAERWLDSKAETSMASTEGSEERRVEIAKDWLSRNDDIPSWMDNLTTAQRLIEEGYDYDKLRKSGFSLPIRGKVVDIGAFGKSAQSFGGDKIR